MSKPPKEIDGANILEWAWSGSKPFGVICFESGEIATEIYGLAICRYANSDKVYRFSCDSKWASEQDSEYGSVAEAKKSLPSQYNVKKAMWQKYE